MLNKSKNCFNFLISQQNSKSNKKFLTYKLFYFSMFSNLHFFQIKESMMGASESTPQEPEPIESDIQETFPNILTAPVSPVASNLAELSVASTSTSNTSAGLDRDILVEIVQEMVYQKMDTDDGNVNTNNSDFWLRFAV